MFQAALVFGVMIAPVFLGTWSLACLIAGSLASSRTRGRLQLGARALLAVLGLSGLLAGIELILVGVLWSFGWLFVADRAVPVLPPLLLSGTAVVLFSVPRVWKLSRSKLGDRRAPVDAVHRSRTADPLLVVPIQAAAVAAAFFAYLTWCPLGVMSPTTVLVPWGMLAASIAALWRRQHRLHSEISRSRIPNLPRLGFRLLRAGAIVAAVGVGLAGLVAYSSLSSALPERFSMMSHENMDYGGGPETGHVSGHTGMRTAHAHERFSVDEQGHAHRHTDGHTNGHGHDDARGDHAAHGGHAAHAENAARGVGQSSAGGRTISVAGLTGPESAEPDRRFTLTAQETRIRLASGKTIGAWTFDGRAPGPELRVRQGDLVEVTLVNEDIADGVTLHWHGVDVPNAEDGVAGLTQNAVGPGERHTYRFRAEQTGTYWYHSHQVSSVQVKKGLFGAFVVEPKDGVSEEEDITVAAHGWYGEDEFVPDTVAFGASDKLDRRRVVPGTEVRLRLINTGSYPMRFTLSGTPFEVTAIDGTEVNHPTEIEDRRLLVAAGGRYDVTFTMPETPVALGLDDEPRPGILFSRNGRGEVPKTGPGLEEFDPSEYGKPQTTPFGAESDFDREFDVVLDNRFGFFDGTFNMLWTINGEVFPDTPMQMVREGDLVKTTFVNRSLMDHPMHLHGHHVLVLSRNGEPATGSPWWADTLNVAPGETYEVAFRADNPGIWMDHCHNLDHAAQGMTMHLAYEGVTTPFKVGGASHNHPE